MSSERIIGIGFLGLGVVGQGVWKHIEANRPALEHRLGAELRLVRAGVRDISRKRAVRVPRGALTTDLEAVVDDPAIQIVCELMGGVKEAKALTLRALKQGKTVVTANKALICECGAELFKAAQAGGGYYFFEASVAGGIPIIKTLKEGLVANRFLLIFGILNGTSNYILTRMEREGLAFEETLDDARQLGYVEADESLDLDGLDAAHKASILAYLAHGVWVKPRQMLLEGIRNVSLLDIRIAGELGYKIKLIASIRTLEDGKSLGVSVLPSLIPVTEVVAGVDDVYNAVSIHGDIVGRTVLIGRGAGQDATSSSVISDIADAVKALTGYPVYKETEGPPVSSTKTLAPLEAMVGRYYLRLKVKDEPGVLARITPLLAREQISLATVNQKPLTDGPGANLFLTTHQTDEKHISQLLRSLRRLRSVLLEPPVLLRIFEMEN